MNFEQTLNYLYSRLPMFTKIGNAAFTKNLNNIIALCNALDNPQQNFKTIHIGGTNGKGSTSHMLAAILQSAGYKTGLYTSPHLKDFRERIRINGKMISKQAVTQFVNKNRTLFEKITPSFFEVTVAMAFNYFYQERVDIAIIEVGLGGRLDSTNLIHPELSIITNISLDHTQILGNTRAEIAIEKAGIIKPNTPIIIGERHPESDSVFIKKASEQNAPLIFTEDVIKITEIKKGKTTRSIQANGINSNYANIQLDLNGSYQLKNIRAVLEATAQLQKIGFHLSNDTVITALRHVKKLTGLQGRWQTLQKKPLVICDTGHNEAGITEVLVNIKQTKYDKLHVVIGMVKDKDCGTVLSLLPRNANYYFCQPNLERALPAYELAKRAKDFQLDGNMYNTVKEALEKAKLKASPDDLIFVGGSTFVVSEVI